MKKAQQGDENAYIELFTQYEQQIYRTAYVYLKNQSDALDVVQETAYRSYKAIKKLRERSIQGIQRASIDMKVSSRRRHKGSAVKTIAAALGLGVVILATTIFNTQVKAAFQSFLQFLPGIGIVVEEDVPQKRYVLARPVQLDWEQGHIIITGMKVDEQTTYVTMSGRNTRRFGSIQLQNESGQVFTLSETQARWSNEEWAAKFEIESPLDIQEQVLLTALGDHEIDVPLTLFEAVAYESYHAMGESATVGEVTFTAIANRLGDKAFVTLIPQLPSNMRIDIRGLNDLHVRDNDGRTYPIIHHAQLDLPKRQFNFELSLNEAQAYTLSIPKINVIYDESVEIALDIPKDKEQEVNQTFHIAGFPFKVLKTERVDDNRLRVYFDVNYNPEAEKTLYDFRLQLGNYMSKHNLDHGLQYIEFGLFNPDSDEVRITIIEPQVILQGPWSFEFPTERYFQ